MRCASGHRHAEHFLISGVTEVGPFDSNLVDPESAAEAEVEDRVLAFSRGPRPPLDFQPRREFQRRGQADGGLRRRRCAARSRARISIVASRPPRSRRERCSPPGRTSRCVHARLTTELGSRPCRRRECCRSATARPSSGAASRSTSWSWRPNTVADAIQPSAGKKSAPASSAHAVSACTSGRAKFAGSGVIALGECRDAEGPARRRTQANDVRRPPARLRATDSTRSRIPCSDRHARPHRAGCSPQARNAIRQTRSRAGSRDRQGSWNAPSRRPLRPRSSPTRDCPRRARRAAPRARRAFDDGSRTRPAGARRTGNGRRASGTSRSRRTASPLGCRGDGQPPPASGWSIRATAHGP